MGCSGTTYARSRAVFQYLKLRVCSNSTTSAPATSSPASHINMDIVDFKCSVSSHLWAYGRWDES